jgi:Gas vesicle synthesis protein GvpL/GvpF
MDATVACYVFGVTGPGAVLPFDIDPAPLAERVKSLAAGRVQAVVSPVAVDDFTGAGPRDPAWLMPRIVAHDRVLMAVAAMHPVLPFRFGALHSSEAVVVHALAGASACLCAALRRVGARLEWTVSISAEEAAPPSAVPPPGGGRGRSYLAARGAQLADRDRSDAAFAVVRRRCAEWGISTKALPPLQDGARRLACLLPRGTEHDMLSRLERLSTETVRARIAVTGPLPPYHFVTDALP